MAQKYKNTNTEMLQDSWKEMYQTLLPTAARSKNPAQLKWPVYNDHCFARIILDNIVGKDTPWTQKVKSPAYMNMSQEQLEQSIALGWKILDGVVDLVQLNESSLEVRGKVGKVRMDRGRKRSAEVDDAGVTGKRRKTGTVSAYFEKATPPIVSDISSNEESKSRTPSPIKVASKPQTALSSAFLSTPLPATYAPAADLKPHLAKIAASPDLTPFRKLVLTALCQVPPGQYTTYGALSTYLSSSPRAVGNALRNNPFAPDVPCHRVLASGGGLGGFGGSWGRKGKEGENDGLKRDILRREGVRFDGTGRVVGRAWEGFR
ncbi:hypothetical protein CJF31_00007461 [Rutstroemia sp. NJR-2017a BVV2]|nr:hypothetical protein CJF31_00007461 [Rutstroemia sp. NJR-2017a BVV2]